MLLRIYLLVLARGAVGKPSLWMPSGGSGWGGGGAEAGGIAALMGGRGGSCGKVAAYSALMLAALGVCLVSALACVSSGSVELARWHALVLELAELKHGTTKR
jgi:hypothetical protein